MKDNIHDVIIIGAGPAGLTAGLYASRAKLDCVLLEKMLPGGQVIFTDIVENYPGFSRPIKGRGLIDEMLTQAKGFGLKIKSEKADLISDGEKNGGYFVITTSSKKSYKSLAVIIAAGASWRKLGVPGEEGLKGRGVSYCATCDGPMFKEKDVIVVGGGDKALEESLFLTKFARTVKLVHRRGQFRAVKEYQQKIAANKKIEPVLNSVITEIKGRGCVESVEILNKETKKSDVIPCAAVFIFVGINPNSGTAKNLIDLDERGFILADGGMRTSRAGIFACGDIIKKDLYQIVTACGEGATAAFNAGKYIDEAKGLEYK